MDSRQLAAANNAIKQKGVLSGVWIEKSEIGGPGEFEHLTDDELRASVIELFIQLFGPKLAITDGSITVNGRALASPSDDEN